MKNGWLKGESFNVIKNTKLPLPNQKKFWRRGEKSFSKVTRHTSTKQPGDIPIMASDPLFNTYSARKVVVYNTPGPKKFVSLSNFVKFPPKAITYLYGVAMRKREIESKSITAIYSGPSNVS